MLVKQIYKKRPWDSLNNFKKRLLQVFKYQASQYILDIKKLIITINDDSKSIDNIVETLIIYIRFLSIL